MAIKTNDEIRQSIPSFVGIDEFWNSFRSGISNLWKRITGSGLTDAAKEANRFSAQQAELAFEREQEFYEKNQSISAQVNQMREAGINPFSSGGSVSSAGGVSSSSPSSVSPDTGGSLFSPLDFALSLMQAQISKQQSDADIRLKDAEAKKLLAEIPWIDKLNTMSIEESRQRISESVSNILNKDADTKVKGMQLGEIASRIKNTEADTNVKLQQLGLMFSEILKNEKSVKVMDAQIYEMMSNAGLNRARAKEVAQSVRGMIQEYGHNEIMNAMTEVSTARDTGTGDSNAYYRGLSEVKRFLTSVLGWWSGSTSIDLPQKRPNRIGFK